MKPATRAVLLIAAALVMTVPVFSEVTTNQNVPIDSYIDNPCLGEAVHLTGELHIVFSMTINNNSAHVRSHFQPAGVSGEGQTTGAKYQGTGITRQDQNIPVEGDPFPMSLTFVNNFRIVGQGSASNYLVHQNVHITVNADGAVTAEVDNNSVECK